MLPGALHGQAFVPHIDSKLLQGLLRLLVEVHAKLLLVRGLLVDPEANLVGEALVVVSSGEQGVSHGADIDVSHPVCSFEIVVQISTLAGFLGIFGGIWHLLALVRFWGHEHLLDADIELVGLNHTRCNIHFHSETARVVHACGLTQHLECQSHGEIRVTVHRLEALLGKGASFFPQILFDLSNAVWIEASTNHFEVLEGHRLVSLVLMADVRLQVSHRVLVHILVHELIQAISTVFEVAHTLILVLLRLIPQQTVVLCLSIGD